MVIHEIGILDRAFVMIMKGVRNSRVEECTLVGWTLGMGPSTASDSGIDVVVSVNFIVADF